jgi:hypothetical protein
VVLLPQGARIVSVDEGFIVDFQLGQMALRYDIAKDGKVATMMVFPQGK